MKLQVPHQHYFNLNYDDKWRFISYWHQIKEVTSLNIKNVLEIGIGNGFVSNYLRKNGTNITTMDIDIDLNPNVIGSVTSIPFANESFNAILCCEVLEHLPFESFGMALAEIYRVTDAFVVLSLPDSGWFISLSLKSPWLNRLDLLYSFRRPGRMAHKFDGQHYWEIGKAGFSLKVITAEIKRVGFTIQKTYRVREFPYHRFLLLRKQVNRKD